MNCLEKYDLQKYQAISKANLLKLEENSITTVTDFLAKKPEIILSITDMSYTDYEKVTCEIFCKCRPEVTTMFGILQNRRHIISTGISKLDKVLGGGIYGGEIVELYGLPSTGKTQMCLTVAAWVDQKAEDISILYLDLKNDFDPLRFNKLCKGCSEKISRIRIYRESKVTDVVNILESFENKLGESNTSVDGNMRLIIIDSLPVMFYPRDTDYDDSGKIFQERILQTIKRIASRFGVAVLMTNHAVTHNLFRKKKNWAKVSERQGEQFKPALGLCWIDVPHFRIYLSTTAQCDEFNGTLCKSTRTGEGQTFIFKISEAGIG